MADTDDGLHHPTPNETFPSPPGAAQTNANVLADRVDQTIVDLRALATGNGTMSSAQLSQAARVIARGLLIVFRLDFGRLDQIE